MKCLRRIRDVILAYGEGDLHVDGFINLDFQSNMDDRKSTSGFVFVLNGGVVSWKCSKQDITTEVKFVAPCDVTKEIVWKRKFIYELGVVPSIELSIPLYYDNNEAIAQAKEPRSHQKSKHIEHCFH